MRVKKKWTNHPREQIFENYLSGGGMGSIADERDVFKKQIRGISGAERKEAGVNRGGA